MSDFGARVKAMYPDRYRDKTPEDINAEAQGALADPAKRASLLKFVRTNFPGAAQRGDDDIVGGISRLRTPTSNAPGITPEQNKAIKSGRVQQGVAKSYGEVLTKEITAKAMNNTPHLQRAAVDNLADVVTPNALAGKTPEDFRRYPVAENWSMLQAKRAQALVENPNRKLAIHNPGALGFGQTVLRDEVTHEPVAMLKHGATVDPSQMVDGTLNKRFVTGEASTLQKQMAGAVDAMDSGSTENLGTNNVAFGLPELGAKLGRQGGLKPASMSREQWQAIVDKDREDKGADDGFLAARGFNNLGRAVKAVGRGYDRFMNWLPTPALMPEHIQEQARKERAESIAQSENEDKDMSTFNDYLSAIPRENKDQIREINAAGEEAIGTEAGEIAQALAPTDYVVPGFVGKALGKAAKAVAPKAAAQVAQAAQVPGQRLAEAWARTKHSRFVDNNPWIRTLDKGDTGAFREAEAEMRNGAQLANQEFADKLDAEMREALQRNNLPFDEHSIAAADQELASKWHSHAARQTLSPQARVLLEVQQPYHEMIIRERQAAGGLADKVYNPLHAFRDQDPFKFADKEESVRDLLRHAEGQAYQRAQRAPNQAGVKGAQEAFDMPSVDELMEVRRARASTNPDISPVDLDKELADLAQLRSSQGLRNAHARMLDHNRYKQKRAVATVMEHLQRTGRTGKPVGPMSAQGTHVRDAYGNARDNRWQADKPLQDEIGKGQVVVRYRAPQGGEPELTLTQGRELIGETEAHKALDGQIVDERHARALTELLEGNPKLREAQKTGAAWNRALGLKLRKETMTQGNMGFHLRNDLSNVLRPMLTEGAGSVLGKVDQVKGIMNGGSQMVDLGKQGQMPADEFMRLFKTFNTQHKQDDIADYVLNGTTGSRALSDLTQRATKSDKATRIAGAIEDARDTARRIANVPGKLTQRATRGLLAGGENKLAKDAGVEDAMKVAHILAQTRRGVPVREAMLNTRQLFVDYANETPLTALVGNAVPFVRYYAGVAPGAAKAAIRNPQRFARMQQAGQKLENADQAMNDGAYDPNLKNLAAQVGGMPMTKWGRKPVTWRVDDALGELGSWGAMITGNDERGAQGLLAPAITTPQEWATGKSPATGRYLYPWGEQMSKMYGNSVFEQINGAAKEGLITEERARKLIAWELGKGYLPETIQAAGRLYGDMGSNPASASPTDDTLRAAQRTAVRQFTGIGVQDVTDFQAKLGNKKAAARFPDKTMVEMKATSVKQPEKKQSASWWNRFSKD